MKRLELTLPSTAENLALDEALLETAEASSEPDEVLRIWESPCPAVVVGRASKVNDEVELGFCRAARIPVLRRCSGGASVVIGPGCLMYAVVLSLDARPVLRFVESAHRYVLERTAAALQSCGVEVALQGTSDLAVDDRKISGNSLRCKRRALLYHGTVLYAMPGALIAQCLKTPPRQPEYRRARAHADFVTCVAQPFSELRAALLRAWDAREPLETWPQELTRELAAERYARDHWNLRL